MRRTMAGVLGLAVWVGLGWVGTHGWAQGAGAEQVPPPGEQADGGGIVARAARLTYVADGAVRVTREDDPEGTAGVLNMALAQGSRVATSERAEAEIEFEDGSLVRLTPNSAVRLEYLGSEGDAKVTTVRVMAGLVYCELRASGKYRYSVLAGAETLWPLENTTVRVNVDESPGVYAVLAGSLMVVHGAGEGTGYRTEVRAGESLRGDRRSDSRYFLAGSVPAESWDNWNEGRDQAALNALASETAVRTGFAGAQGYGWSDLDEGGTWYDQGGQGPVWQPAEAQALDFDPYGYGSWSYFPGGGYTWASGYAWGWTPFRCGRWRYWDRFGWGWQPDGSCRTDWRFGVGRGNVYRGPRGYVPVRVPIRRPVGVHPIIAGSSPGRAATLRARDRRAA